MKGRMDTSVSPSREHLDRLADSIATLSLHIDIAKHQLLTKLREFDAHEGWRGTGALSTAAWLAWRIGIGAVAAREHVRVARALGGLPQIDSAFAAGELSYTKVRALTRVATAESERGFIDVAMQATASHLETIVAAYRNIGDEAETGMRAPQSRVRRRVTDDGMIRIELTLRPDQANVLWEAMNKALDVGRSEQTDVPAESSGCCGSDADVSAESPGAAAAAAVIPRETELANALVNVAQAYLDNATRTLGSGYELVVLTTPEQLEHGAAGIGGYLRDGTPVPLHVARMLACDCSRVDVDMSDSGEILNVGRARRTIPSAIGRALWVRDGGCRVPGCNRKRHLHAHHIRNWTDGGKTAAVNLVLLCTGHHTAVHEGSLFVGVHEGKIEFTNASGVKLRPGPVRDANIEIT